MNLTCLFFADVNYTFTTKKCRIKNYLSFWVFEWLSIVDVDCLAHHDKGITDCLPSDLIFHIAIVRINWPVIYCQERPEYHDKHQNTKYDRHCNTEDIDSVKVAVRESLLASVYACLKTSMNYSTKIHNSAETTSGAWVITPDVLPKRWRQYNANLELFHEPQY